MKKYVLFSLVALLHHGNYVKAQTVWGTNSSRTESRENASLQGDAGAKSGFFESAEPVGYPVDPDNPFGTNVTWNHLLDVRHSNLSNNYAMQFAGNFFTQNLYFRKVNGDVNTPWNRVLIEKGGKVGIGTTNPKEALQIGSQFVIGDGGWKCLNYNMAWEPSISAQARMTNGSAASIMFTDQANIVFFNAPNGNAGTSIGNGVNSMVIHRSGQVGIGTSTTATSFADNTTKFFVEGGIRSRKVKVDQVSWADHVFKEGYTLMGLKELEAYIQQNKHLPGVPTEENVKKEGQDLGEMNKILLQKVEELTLHLIELNKKIDLLEKQHAPLKTSTNEN